MAEEIEGGPGADTAAEGDGGELEFLDWSCDMMGVERIQADPDDDDSDDIFEVKFQVAGPNANAEVGIIVSDHTDEAEVIAVAFDTLHRAMKAWGGLTEDRRIAARDFREG